MKLNILFILFLFSKMQAMELEQRPPALPSHANIEELMRENISTPLSGTPSDSSQEGASKQGAHIRIDITSGLHDEVKENEITEAVVAALFPDKDLHPKIGRCVEEVIKAIKNERNEKQLTALIELAQARKKNLSDEMTASEREFVLRHINDRVFSSQLAKFEQKKQKHKEDKIFLLKIAGGLAGTLGAAVITALPLLLKCYTKS